MKKLFFCLIASLVILACNQKAKEGDDTSKKNDEMKALYEKNLASLKSGLTAFENNNIDGWAASIADSAYWTSPTYGDTIHTKAHWKEAISFYLANWDNIKLNNATFLPGVDSATHELDGSVRYYGSWDAVHKSGVKTSVYFYGTYDFNKDNKAISGADFFDVGGLMNAVSGK